MLTTTRLRRRARRLAIAAGMALLSAMPASHAQGDTYPSAPLRLIVPYGPGGTGDFIARQVAQQAAPAFPHGIVVENKPGAAGTIGAAMAARAEPDGYTVLLAYTSEMVINPVVQKGVPYDVQADFAPVAFAGATPLRLVAKPGLPAEDIDGLVRLARSQPGGISSATAGVGSPAHIASALLARLAGVEFLHVPYKGGSQAVTDTVAGNVDIYFSGMPPAVPFVKSGKLRALGVTATSPSPALPGVPALAQGPYARLDLSGWFGFFAPAGVPDPVLARLHDALSGALAAAPVRERLLSQGVETKPMDAAAFGRFVADERSKYRSLLSELAISSD